MRREHGTVEGVSAMGPFALEPVCKDYLWGGTRLRDEWGLCLLYTSPSPRDCS